MGRITRIFGILLCFFLSLVFLTGSLNTNIRYNFDSTISKKSDEVILGPAVFYKNMIVFANGHTQEEYTKYKNAADPNEINFPEKTTGIYFIDNGKISKFQWEGKVQFRLMERNKSGIFFGGCYSYPYFNLLVKFNFKNYAFTEITDIYSENYLEVFNNEYTWTYEGFDEGIVETSKNGAITKYRFDDFLERNNLYSLQLTNKCLWSVWTGHDEEGETTDPLGLSVMDLRTNQWTHFLGCTKDESLKKYLVPLLDGFVPHSTCTDDNGDMYVLCYSEDKARIVRYNYSKSRWEKFIDVNDINYCYGGKLFVFLQDYVIMNSGTSVSIINKKSKEVEKTYMNSFYTYQIMTDSKKETLYFCTDKGIYTQKLTK